MPWSMPWPSTSPGTQVSEPKGGMHLWVVMPEDFSALDLHRDALQHGLGFAPGPSSLPMAGAPTASA